MQLANSRLRSLPLVKNTVFLADIIINCLVFFQAILREKEWQSEKQQMYLFIYIWTFFPERLQGGQKNVSEHIMASVDLVNVAVRGSWDGPQ